MVALLKSRSFVVALLITPLVFIMGELLADPIQANPIEWLQLRTGRTAVRLLVFSLWLSPLSMLFPKNGILKRLQGHRRVIGLAVFGYVVLHFIIYLLDRANLEDIISDFSRVFVLCGMSAAFILLLMALTSSNRMVQRLGRRNWKRLHQAVYAVGILVFAHMLLKEKSDPLEAWLLFLPLALIELIRFSGYRKSMRLDRRR